MRVSTDVLTRWLDVFKNKTPNKDFFAHFDALCKQEKKMPLAVLIYGLIDVHRPRLSGSKSRPSVLKLIYDTEYNKMVFKQHDVLADVMAKYRNGLKAGKEWPALEVWGEFSNLSAILHKDTTKTPDIKKALNDYIEKLEILVNQDYKSRESGESLIKLYKVWITIIDNWYSGLASLEHYNISSWLTELEKELPSLEGMGYLINKLIEFDIPSSHHVEPISILSNSIGSSLDRKLIDKIVREKALS